VAPTPAGVAQRGRARRAAGRQGGAAVRQRHLGPRRRLEAARLDLGKIRDADLPDDVRKLPAKDRPAFIAGKAKARERIQQSIKTSAAKREQFVKDATAKPDASAAAAARLVRRRRPRLAPQAGGGQGLQVRAVIADPAAGNGAPRPLAFARRRPYVCARPKREAIACFSVSRRWVLAAVIVSAACARPCAAQPVTAKDAQALAQSIHAAAAKGDLSVLQAAIDDDEIFDRTVKGMTIKPDVKAGMRDAGGRISAGLAEAIAAQVRQGGSYRLVRVNTAGGEPRPLFRLISAQGLNYHEMHLFRDGGARCASATCSCSSSARRCRKTCGPRSCRCCRRTAACRSRRSRRSSPPAAPRSPRSASSSRPA
jgi:hypothetical protein